LDKHFESKIYSLWHLFKDEQRKVLDQILQLTYEGVDASYRQIYDNNYTIMNFYNGLQQRLPRPFLAAAEYIINSDINKIFEEDTLDTEKLKRLIDETERWMIKIDKTTIEYNANTWVNSAMEQLAAQPEDKTLISLIETAMKILKPLNLSLNLWSVQNIYFDISRGFGSEMIEKGKNGNADSRKWAEAFRTLGYYLNVKI
jgi:hypothetical protein